MGSFSGHVLPGFFFLLFGIWWTVSLCRRYFRCFTQGGKHFRSSLIFLCPCCPTIPVESILKFVASLSGIGADAAAAFLKEGHYAYVINVQHICMYFFFALNGFVEILLFYRVPLPKDTDYVTLVLALVMKAFLFYFHSHGRSMLESHIHMFLIYVSMTAAVAVLLEMRYRDNVHAALTKTACSLLLGTWFIQIAFILYNPFPDAKPWSEDDHHEIMLATTLFAWHIIGIIVFIAFVGFITWWIMKPSSLKVKFASKLLDHLNGEQLKVLSMKERLIMGMESAEEEN